MAAILRSRWRSRRSSSLCYLRDEDLYILTVLDFFSFGDI